MEITTVRRQISGFEFDNLAFTANMQEGDDPVKVAMQLDGLLRTAMVEIKENKEARQKAEQEQWKTVSLLERALNEARKMDIPF